MCNGTERGDLFKVRAGSIFQTVEGVFKKERSYDGRVRRHCYQRRS